MEALSGLVSKGARRTASYGNNNHRVQSLERKAEVLTIQRADLDPAQDQLSFDNHNCSAVIRETGRHNALNAPQRVRVPACCQAAACPQPGAQSSTPRAGVESGFSLVLVLILL